MKKIIEVKEIIARKSPLEINTGLQADEISLIGRLPQEISEREHNLRRFACLVETNYNDKYYSDKLYKNIRDDACFRIVGFSLTKRNVYDNDYDIKFFCRYDLGDTFTYIVEGYDPKIEGAKQYSEYMNKIIDEIHQALINLFSPLF